MPVPPYRKQRKARPSCCWADIMTEKTILLGDIGGTNARFALMRGNDLTLLHPGHRATKDFPSLEDAIGDYLAKDTGGLPPDHAAIAVACPVSGDAIRFTNNAWSFSVRELKDSLGLNDVKIINDFTAQALAIPYLNESVITPIGPKRAGRPNAAKAVLGPGTGLGVSGLIPTPGGGWTALSGEGGHVGVSPENETEIAILQFAWREIGRTSMERFLCGAGLVLLYRALREINGEIAHDYSAADVTERALSGNCPACLETVNQFCAFLGSLAGDLALVLGAHGGVYIAGGIAPRLGPLLEASPFRARFESKGRLTEYNAAIPTYLVSPHDNPALLGVASVYLNQE